MADSSSHNETIQTAQVEAASRIFSGTLDKDLNQFKEIFLHFPDMVYRKFKIGGILEAAIFFLDGFIDSKNINLNVLNPLLNFKVSEDEVSSAYLSELMNLIQDELIPAAQISSGVNFEQACEHVLCGEAVLLINGVKQALFISIKKIEKRSIEESSIETIIRGPQDSFTEDLRTNISLIRRRLKTSKLKMQELKVGRLSKTKVEISYIEGIADISLVEEVKGRIVKINIDAILESGYIEELIEDNRFSIFSQFGYTDRPDKLSSCLLEGQIGIIIENTPIVLIAPHTFFEAMQSSEDYYERGILVSAIRFIRYFFLGSALLLPSFYVALVTFHQGMIPRNLLLAIWASRENVPFPVLFEALIMEIFFEGLREASLRLPGIAGGIVGIVGTLVIGQAAVQANIVSASMVIIVSITGISSFTIPQYNLALSIRILRFLMLILAGVLGLYGMFMGLLIVLIHMAKLRSFGVPYLSPIAPLDISSIKDTFVRSPWWAMITRPRFISKRNSKRMNKYRSKSSSYKKNNKYGEK